jgi:hypothetical protein
LPFSLSFLLPLLIFLPFSLSFLLACLPLLIFFLVFPLVHLLRPTTFFFVLFPLPMSPFSSCPIPSPTEKSLVSPFLHSFSLLLLNIFLYPTFTSLPFLFSYFAMVPSFFCISRSCFLRSLSMNIFFVSYFSLSFPFCLITFSFPHSPLICCLLFPSTLHPVITTYVIFCSSLFFIFHFPFQPCYSLRHVVFFFLPFLFCILKSFP